MFRTKSQKKLRLSTGVSSSQFISLPSVCSVSGQKINNLSLLTCTLYREFCLTVGQEGRWKQKGGGEDKTRQGKRMIWEVGRRVQENRRNKKKSLRWAGQKTQYFIPTYSIIVLWHNLYVTITTMLSCITTKEVRLHKCKSINILPFLIVPLILMGCLFSSPQGRQ